MLQQGLGVFSTYFRRQVRRATAILHCSELQPSSAFRATSTLLQLSCLKRPVAPLRAVCLLPSSMPMHVYCASVCRPWCWIWVLWLLPQKSEQHRLCGAQNWLYPAGLHFASSPDAAWCWAQARLLGARQAPSAMTVQPRGAARLGAGQQELLAVRTIALSVGSAEVLQ